MMPKLVVSRKAAKAKIEEQIAGGEALLQRPIRDSTSEYQQFQDDVRLWKSYSISLIGTLFDTDEIARSLGLSSVGVLPNSPIPKKWEQFKRETNFFLVSLRSILNNLGLYKRDTSTRSVIGPNLPKESTMNQTINVHGHNARVNIGSTDISTNVVHQDGTFSELRKAIESGVSDDVERTAIIQKLSDLEAATDHDSGAKRYQAFISAAANHMTIIGPYLPALGHWVHNFLVATT